MLCEKCKKNNASFFFEENINGKKRSLALCSDCAEEMKKSGEFQMGSSLFDSAFIPSSFHNDIFGGLFSGAEMLPKSAGAKSCPGCGYTFAEFRRVGKAGCSQCYSTFAAELAPSIRSIHGNSKHTGRAPAKAKAKNKKENELKALKKELKAAISDENFEEAAILRDKIRDIEANM